MFNYSEVAVEIWREILLAVIDLPYVLDTLLDREMFQWKVSNRYHNPATYMESELQRRTLRLVCHSWRAFADGYKYRWITYNPGVEADSREQEDAMEAIRSATVDYLDAPQKGDAYVISRPRRILFHVRTEKDMEMLRKTIDHCCTKVTTFYIKCVDGYEDQIYEHLILQSPRLPMLRCLALQAPKRFPKPLLALSTALPKLITLTLRSDNPYQPEDGDFLLLPDLESLKVDLATSEEASLKRWDLRGMIELSTPIGRSTGGTQMILEPIRSLGVNLRVLNINRLYVPIRLPVEFWTWCPCLIELVASFSWIHLDRPAPTNHPLKYFVHLGTYDNLSNPFIVGSPVVQQPVLLQNLQSLPPGLEVFIMWRSWSGYSEFLTARNRYIQTEREDILIRMDNICAARSIRAEDRDGVTLNAFLRREGTRRGLRE